MDDRLTLEFLLVGQGEVCVITNTSCSIEMKTSNQVERSLLKLKETSTQLFKIGPDDLWILFSLLGPGPRGGMVGINTAN